MEDVLRGGFFKYYSERLGQKPVVVVSSVSGVYSCVPTVGRGFAFACCHEVARSCCRDAGFEPSLLLLACN